MALAFVILALASRLYSLTNGGVVRGRFTFCSFFLFVLMLMACLVGMGSMAHSDDSDGSWLEGRETISPPSSTPQRGPPVPPPLPICWLKERTRCLIEAPIRGVRILPSKSGVVIGLWRAEQYEVSPTSVSGGMDLLQAPQAPPFILMDAVAEIHSMINEGKISSTDALVILADLTRITGLDYHLPRHAMALKMAIGFLPETEIDLRDYEDILRAHLQIDLGVQQPTARFLLQLMHLKGFYGELESPDVVATAGDQLRASSHGEENPSVSNPGSENEHSLESVDESAVDADRDAGRDAERDTESSEDGSLDVPLDFDELPIEDSSGSSLASLASLSKK